MQNIITDPQILAAFMAARSERDPFIPGPGKGCPRCGGEAGRSIVTAISENGTVAASRTESVSSDGHCLACVRELPLWGLPHYTTLPEALPEGLVLYGLPGQTPLPGYFRMFKKQGRDYPVFEPDPSFIPAE